GNLRKFAFWTFDFVKGSLIRDHYRDIALILENFGSKESKARRSDHLKRLLEHATATVPFYEAQKFVSLTDFPVVNKDLIRKEYDSFKSRTFLHKKSKAILTSGSTGNPFKIYQDQNKLDRHKADIIYFIKQGGFEIGSRLIFMKVWNDINKKSPLKLWMENIRPYSIFNHSDEDIKNLLENLRNDKSNKGVFVFASTCDYIADYLDSINAEPENFNITSFITNSDSLNSQTKEKMEYYFMI